MKKMTKSETKKVNGGIGYECKTNRYCHRWTVTASAMGYHFLLGHPNERKNWAYKRIF